MSLSVEAADQLHVAAQATRRLPARRESPERAQPSLVGLGGTPNPYPLRFPPGKRADLRRWGRAHSRAPLRDGTKRAPAGESREGGALFGGGLGHPPTPLSAPLPAREAGGPPEAGSGAQPYSPSPAIPQLQIRGGAGRVFSPIASIGRCHSCSGRKVKGTWVPLWSPSSPSEKHGWASVWGYDGPSPVAGSR